MARPSKYTDKLATEISRRLMEGESMRAICRDKAMPAFSTVMLWIVDGKHPKFSDQYILAREAQAHNHVDEMLDMRHGVLSGDIEPNAARVVADIIKWSSERMARKTYGKQEASQDTQSAQPVTINIVEAKKQSSD